MILGFKKLFIILRTLIIRKTIQCTASHHTFTQQYSVNSISIIFSYLMLCYGYTHIIKSDAEHKRNSHDMKLNTSYPFMLKSKFSEIQVMHHTNVGTTGTIRRNLQTTTIYHFLQTQIQLHMEKK
ncbi:hypothetical protein T11_9937 [Trichinella zimbabwensis]|uniref:Uncharacterized protein n=1 Tax=Trichinella zimbabwensis TaxID=268475 RepID=A0A0V1GT50_9BILA|nr:hypothetical protein T11_9937 [Trichinella zimbabwensis]